MDMAVAILGNRAEVVDVPSSRQGDAGTRVGFIRVIVPVVKGSIPTEAVYMARYIGVHGADTPIPMAVAVIVAGLTHIGMGVVIHVNPPRHQFLYIILCRRICMGA